MILLPPISTLFPSTTLFRSRTDFAVRARHRRRRRVEPAGPADGRLLSERDVQRDGLRARGSGSHAALVFRRRGSRLLVVRDPGGPASMSARRLAAAFALAGALAVSSLGGAGCAPVRPWERGAIARMAKHADRCGPARTYEAHLWMVREGPAGGTGRPGGGCGCN